MTKQNSLTSLFCREYGVRRRATTVLQCACVVSSSGDHVTRQRRAERRRRRNVFAFEVRTFVQVFREPQNRRTPRRCRPRRRAVLWVRRSNTGRRGRYGVCGGCCADPLPHRGRPSTGDVALAADVHGVGGLLRRFVDDRPQPFSVPRSASLRAESTVTVGEFAKPPFPVENKNIVYSICKRLIDWVYSAIMGAAEWSSGKVLDT